ncbi:unnamed protein product [Ilex paraguariensis]|uniref:Rab3 GTPase-activating protein catalytic subunit n=1 Tax=Ilex paraguariensis TaxID=185542 RepID=A0ABC8UCR2_9AQUA
MRSNVPKFQLGSGFVIAEVALSTNSSLSKLFYECRDYIVATCQGSNWVEKVDDICQVYETVEMMLLNPDEVLKITNQPEETSIAGEPKNRFKRLGFIFGGKDRHGKPESKDQKNSEENPARQQFSSIFSKKPPKASSASPAEKPVCSIENDWTVI